MASVTAALGRPAEQGARSRGARGLDRNEQKPAGDYCPDEQDEVERREIGEQGRARAAACIAKEKRMTAGQDRRKNGKQRHDTEPGQAEHRARAADGAGPGLGPEAAHAVAPLNLIRGSARV
jgi:hypothetical protein